MVEVRAQQATCRYNDDVQLALNLWTMHSVVVRDCFPEHGLQFSRERRGDSSDPVGHEGQAVEWPCELYGFKRIRQDLVVGCGRRRWETFRQERPVLGY